MSIFLLNVITIRYDSFTHLLTNRIILTSGCFSSKIPIKHVLEILFVSVNNFQTVAKHAIIKSIFLKLQHIQLLEMSASILVFQA